MPLQIKIDLLKHVHERFESKETRGDIENASGTKVLSFLIDCDQNLLTLYNVLKFRQKFNDKIMGFENTRDCRNIVSTNDYLGTFLL